MRFNSRSRDSSRTRDSSRSRDSSRLRNDEAHDTKEYLTQNRIGFLNASGDHNNSRPQSGRHHQQRMTVSERLDLDGRNLEEVPKLNSAYNEALKLLNLQHNLIISLRGVELLRQLVFLDLYDNRIMDMRPISSLINLRVLMLGKNYIKRIDGLINLERLDVLDMHANLLTSTNGLERQKHLRTLNLAGNQLKDVDFEHLSTLTELNLRRNQIERITGLHSLEYLSRVYLSFNNIAKWDDIWCLGDITDLTELTLG